MYLYIRTNYFPGLVPPSKTPWPPAALGDGRMLSCCVYLPPASPPFAATRHSYDQS